MRFLALHLHDLQSVRWLPLMLAAIVVPLLPAKSDLCATSVAITVFCTTAVLWFFWTRRHIRNRFGESNLSPQQRGRSIYRDSWLTRLYGLFCMLILIWSFVEKAAWNLHPHWSGVVASMQIVLIYGNFALDKTNLVERRVIKASTAIAFALLLFGDQALTDPILHKYLHTSQNHLGAAEMVAVGTLFLLNALYDYTLLYRCARASRAEVTLG